MIYLDSIDDKNPWAMRSKKMCIQIQQKDPAVLFPEVSVYRM
jgi:hypothetical protein